MRPRFWIGAAAALALAAIAAFVLLRFAPGGPPACHPVLFDGDVFTVCELDLARDDFRLVTDDATGAPLRSFAALERALGRLASRVRFAMNAGMFDEGGRAIGLYVENGEERHSISTSHGPGNFHLLPNGVFSIDRDGQARVETTPAFIARRDTPVWATQSGPMLVIEGALHPAFQEDGPSRLIRNGVGVVDPHHALFVISETPVSFGKFARLFRDALHCRNALFLDGSVSSLWAPQLNRRDSNDALGPLLVVLARR